jgi:hypothetical protein
MSESKTSPQFWATVMIVVAIIGCLGAVVSAFIAKVPLPTQSVATQIIPVTQVIYITEVSSVTNVAPSLATALPQPTINSAFISNADSSCSKYGGQPVMATDITNEQVQRWRSIGQVDSDSKVGIVIYCEIHQIPNFKGFTEGDTIPANAIITADLGFNWSSQYVGALERLVYHDGGWGVFLSLRSFTVEHASDLPNQIGGQYWIVK